MVLANTEKLLVVTRPQAGEMLCLQTHTCTHTHKTYTASGCLIISDQLGLFRQIQERQNSGTAGSLFFFFFIL